MDKNDDHELNEAANQLLDFLVRNKSSKIEAFLSFYDGAIKNKTEMQNKLKEIDNKINEVYTSMNSMMFNVKVCMTKCFDIIQNDIERF